MKMVLSGGDSTIILLLRLLAIPLLAIILLQCQPDQGVGDKLIAEVFDKRLYQSEADQVIPASASAADSLLFRNAYVERWIRERLMMIEAEQNLPADLALEDLVQDYRESMIRHQYEKMLVENLLDTTIVQTELETYYQENKSQYILESVIVRCRFIRVDSLDSEIRKEIESLWTTDDLEEHQRLLSLCNEHAKTFYLNDSVWHRLAQVQAEMPPGTVDEKLIRDSKTFKISNDESYYFLKILEARDEEEIAPLTFIKEQASKVILHKRKLELLEKIKEDLYHRASSQKRIKVHTG